MELGFVEGNTGQLVNELWGEAVARGGAYLVQSFECALAARCRRRKGKQMQENGMPEHKALTIEPPPALRVEAAPAVSARRLCSKCQKLAQLRL